MVFGPTVPNAQSLHWTPLSLKCNDTHRILPPPRPGTQEGTGLQLNLLPESFLSCCPLMGDVKEPVLGIPAPKSSSFCFPSQKSQ